MVDRTSSLGAVFLAAAMWSCAAEPSGPRSESVEPALVEPRDLAYVEPQLIDAFELGTRRRELALEPQPSRRGALAAAWVIAAEGAINLIEIEAQLGQPLVRADARPVLVLGLAGRRLLAHEVERSGLGRRYRAVLDQREEVRGELSVWSGHELRAAGVRIDRITLVSLEPVALEPVIDEVAPAALPVRAGGETHLAQVVWAQQQHRWALAPVAAGARVRLAWTALGPPTLASGIAVRVRCGTAVRDWQGLSSPVRGWSQVELAWAPGGGVCERGAEVEVVAASGVGVAVTEPVLVPTSPRPSVPGLVVVVIDQLPADALSPRGPMPQLAARAVNLERRPLAAASTESAANAATLLTGVPALAHGVGFGGRVPAASLLSVRARSRGFFTAALGEAGSVIESPGGAAGFQRVTFFGGGWPRDAAASLAAELAVFLVDDPPEPFLLVAHLAGTSPPWRPQGRDGVRYLETRQPPSWRLERRLEVRGLRWVRAVFAPEALELERDAAGRLDRALAQVFAALRQRDAPPALAVVVSELGGGSLRGELLLSRPPGVAPLREGEVSPVEAAQRLLQLAGLPQRGATPSAPAGDSAARDSAGPVSLVESLAVDGRVTACRGAGRCGWVELSPWETWAPRLDGEPELARWAAQRALEDTAGSRLAIVGGARGRKLILRGLGLSAESVFVVSGAARAVLDGARGEVRLEVPAGADAVLVLAPTELQVELDAGATVLPLGASSWSLEEVEGELRAREHTSRRTAVISFSPSV